MRLTFIANELPYPPNHGGTVDMWRRLCALHEAGVTLRVICWHNDATRPEPDPAHLAKVREVAEYVEVFQLRRGLRARVARLAGLGTLPWSVSGRSLDVRSFNGLWQGERAAGSDGVWLDGLYGGAVAMKLARALDVPLFYRSHNIEHLYTGRQLASATHWRERLRWLLRNANVERFERAVMGAARNFFDISQDDLAFWRSQGFTHGEWLPTLVESHMAAALSAPMGTEAPLFDVGYLGNLFMPNNVFGIGWFLEQVVPLLLKARPNIRIFIAGSKPAPQVLALLDDHPQVTLLANPESAIAVLRSARVLINPVFAGSGVNVKSVEMLFTNAALVSTPQGLAGLPGTVTACFRIASTAVPFAAEIISALEESGSCAQAVQIQREHARRHFLSSRIRDIVPILAQAQRGELTAAPPERLATTGN